MRHSMCRGLRYNRKEKGTAAADIHGASTHTCTGFEHSRAHHLYSLRPIETIVAREELTAVLHTIVSYYPSRSRFFFHCTPLNFRNRRDFVFVFRRKQFITRSIENYVNFVILSNFDYKIFHRKIFHRPLLSDRFV